MKTTVDVCFVVVPQHLFYILVVATAAIKKLCINPSKVLPNVQYHHVAKKYPIASDFQAHAETVAKHGDLVMAMDRLLLIRDMCLIGKSQSILVLL